METLNLYDPPSAQAVAAREATVFVEGLRRDDLAALEWELLPAPRFGRCRVAHRLPAGVYPGGTEGVGLLPPIGARLDLVMEDAPRERFCGVVTVHRLDAGAEGMNWVAEASSRLAAELSGTITGRTQWQGGEGVRIDPSHVYFNGGLDLLASGQSVDVHGRSCRVFSGQSDGEAWTVASALAYLLATELPAEMAAPSEEELAAQAGQVEMDDLDVAGRTLGEALVEVARRGGLEVRSARDGLGVVFFQPGFEGLPRGLSLQPAGSAAWDGQSNLFRGEVMLSGRSRPSVLALGDCKVYESTFELQPGWDGGLDTGRWRDTSASASGDWPAMSNVYRRWVLNEHGWYDDEPFGLAPFSFGPLSEDFKLDIPRRFLPCVSTDASGQSLGVVVEVRCGADLPWRRWPVAAWVSPGECAVYLGGDALPGDFFQAAAHGEASVRVTAAVRSDTRISARHEGDPAGGLRVLDLGAKAHWRVVLPSSALAGGSNSACDDTPMLQQWADAQGRRLRFRSQGHVTLAWIDTSFFIGDRVAGVDGQGIDLSDGRACPYVRDVKHDFVAQHTILKIGG